MPRFDKIDGGTYILKLENSNVGLYVDKKQGILIDCGYTEDDANLIQGLLESENIKPAAIIVTHAHPENSGGCHFLKKKTHCKVYCSRPERLVMENPTRSNYMPTVKTPVALLPALETVPVETDENEASEVETQEKLKEKQVTWDEESIEKAFIRPKPCLIDGLLTVDKPFVTPTQRKLRILDLAGHTQGQIGVRTPDGVIFTADALLPLSEFEKVPIPFSENITALKRTHDYLLHSEYNLFAPTHGDVVEFSIVNEVLYNKQQIKMVEDAILMHLQMPRIKEELVALMFATFSIEESVPNFYTLSASIMAFLNSLKHERRVTIIHEDGKTRWFATHV